MKIGALLMAMLAVPTLGCEAHEGDIVYALSGTILPDDDVRETKPQDGYFHADSFQVPDLAGLRGLGELFSKPDSSGTQVTYANTVQGIIETYCYDCHGGGTSMPLATYQEVKAYVDSGSLKTKLEEGHGGLAQDIVELLLGWIAAGAPEGSSFAERYDPCGTPGIQCDPGLSCLPTTDRGEICTKSCGTDEDCYLIEEVCDDGACIPSP